MTSSSGADRFEVTEPANRPGPLLSSALSTQPVPVSFHSERNCRLDHWAIGTKRVRGAEGTWRDAEDGVLGRNAISQGSVDATVGFNLCNIFICRVWITNCYDILCRDA
jgi:hypothetical protein